MLLELTRMPPSEVNGRGLTLSFTKKRWQVRAPALFLVVKQKFFLVVRVDATVHLYGGMRCNDVSNAAHVSIHWTVEYGIEMLRPSTPIKCPTVGCSDPTVTL